MMQLGMLNKEGKDTIREVPCADVRILWVNDFYDGPLQGVAEVHGTRYLFEIIDRVALATDDELRAYWLIALNSEQLQDEEEWHDLFCRKVGTQFDYTGRPAPRPEEVCPDDFYKLHRSRPQRNIGDNQVIGWFRL